MQSVWALLLFALLAFGCTSEGPDVVTASDGVEIRFDHQGNGSPALVLIHGWGNDRTVWDAQVAHFSKRYEVVNIDLPGFGESGNNREHFTISGFGEDVATVIREREMDQVILVGFSAGANVAVEAATRIPASVTGIVFVDSFHDIEEQAATPVSDDSVNFYMDIVTNPTNEKMVKYRFYTKNQEASFQRVATMLQGAPRAGWRESLVDTMRWRREDCIEVLKRLQVPVMAINAEFRPTNAEAVRKHVPSFRVKTIADSGHLVMWDATQEFNRLLEQSIQEMMGEG